MFVASFNNTSQVQTVVTRILNSDTIRLSQQIRFLLSSLSKIGCVFLAHNPEAAVVTVITIAPFRFRHEYSTYHHAVVVRLQSLHCRPQ